MVVAITRASRAAKLGEIAGLGRLIHEGNVDVVLPRIARLSLTTSITPDLF